MRRGILLVLTASLLASAGVGAVPRKPSQAAKPPAVPKLMQSCDAHKFETVVHAVVDGEPHDSKVKLCGVEGQSDADWIKTLKDAIAKLDANKDMPSAMRDQIVTAINAEIARLSIVGTSPPAPEASDAALAPAVPLSRDYSLLPPLPPSRETPAVPAAPLQREFAQLPPLPAPAPRTPVSPRPTVIPATAPRLTFGCDTPGELTTDAPCADFQRETVLTIHARDDVPAGTLLQFVRNDRSQAALSLDGLKRGKALRTALPREVCGGFTSGKLELRIVRGEAGSEVLSTDGPYSLRC
jgi:hypothetical protein